MFQIGSVKCTQKVNFSKELYRSTPNGPGNIQTGFGHSGREFGGCQRTSKTKQKQPASQKQVEDFFFYQEEKEMRKGSVCLGNKTNEIGEGRNGVHQINQQPKNPDGN
jgi:hypothetical protein